MAFSRSSPAFEETAATLAVAEDGLTRPLGVVLLVLVPEVADCGLEDEPRVKAGLLPTDWSIELLLS